MIEPNKDMWCRECGHVKVVTAMGAILCPDGCGKVLSNSEITSRMLQNASRDRERWEWLQTLPVAKRLQEAANGRFIKPILLTALGAKYETCRPQGSRSSRPDRSSKAKWLAQPEHGMLIVNLEGEPRYARPCP
jgi:hypothetical protein